MGDHRGPRPLPAIGLVLLAGLGLAERCASVGPHPSRPPRQEALGFNVHAPGGPRAALLLDRAAEAGAGWVRIDVVWSAVEPRRGADDWRLYDELVAAAGRRDLAVLGVLVSTPAWATDGVAGSGVPRDPADWAAFCRRAAERYRGRVAAWEVWNEPNHRRFWGGTRRQYREVVLVPGAQAIHAADPAALVVGPGLAHFESRSWRSWLALILRHDGAHLDVVSHHVYDDDPGRLLGELEEVRRVVRSARAADRPFWLTETGWQGPPAGRERQAAAYRRFLELWRAGERLRWLEKTFFYELVDDPRVEPWGVLDAEGRPKPAYRVLREPLAAAQR
jgi:hypothetical protein